MDPNLKLVLEEIQKSKEEFGRRFDEHNEQWERRFADLELARTARDAAVDKRLDSIELVGADTAYTIGRRVADLEAVRDDRVTALEVAATDLGTWRPKMEALVDDLRLEMQKLTQGRDSKVFDVLPQWPTVLASSSPAPNGHGDASSHRDGGFGTGAVWTHVPVMALHDRFDRDQKEALIRQLFHIKQTSTVSDYVERFSILIDRLKSYYASTDPLFYTMRFIDGLRPDLKAMILVSRPQTLDAAICMALVREEVAGQSGAQSSFRSLAPVEWSHKPTPRTALPLPPPPPRVEKPVAKPAAAEPTATSSATGALVDVKAYRRALGLCYKCNAKWSKDHRCAPEVLHAVEALWESLDPDVVPAAETSDDQPIEQVFLAISKSAVFGVPAARTIRLLGSMSDILVHILVDSGSSSSFINDTTAVQLHHLDPVSISSCVQVTGGGVLQSSLLLRQVQ
ncbi:unnamed protein product [Miscanthus lutarioriparius]|uniref:Retrotransposon gag domain-containing protein n=1 Tax=Miscanthus lutarioriparius TaxID=422564 RepID=A0A811NI62_9POAL|nr:unnamed protein product [Miscanthus lutarioriparius]